MIFRWGTAAQQRWRHPLARPVCRHTLRQEHRAVARKLFIATGDPEMSQSEIIQSVFRQQFGRNRTATERLIFTHYAAPIVRAASLHRRARSRHPPFDRAKNEFMQAQCAWLEQHDPDALRMIDLFCVGRCSPANIAGLQACALADSFARDTILLPDDGCADLTAQQSKAAIRSVIRTLRLYLGLHRSFMQAPERAQ